MMMLSQNAMPQPCPYKGPANPYQAEKQVAEQSGCSTAGIRWVNCRAEGHTPRSQAVGTRQEATSQAKDYLITQVNKFDVGTEGTAFVFTAPLLEGEPEVQHPMPYTAAQLVPLTLFHHTNCAFMLMP